MELNLAFAAGAGRVPAPSRNQRVDGAARVRFGPAGLAGRPLWVDAVRLEGDIAAALAAPFAFGDARSTATILYVGADAAAHLAGVRALIGAARGGATSFDGLLIVRLADADPAALRRDVVRIAGGLRALAAGFAPRLPAVWRC